jgi:hypothetical protein
MISGSAECGSTKNRTLGKWKKRFLNDKRIGSSKTKNQEQGTNSQLGVDLEYSFTVLVIFEFHLGPILDCKVQVGYLR